MTDSSAEAWPPSRILSTDTPQWPPIDANAAAAPLPTGEHCRHQAQLHRHQQMSPTLKCGPGARTPASPAPTCQLEAKVPALMPERQHHQRQQASPKPKGSARGQNTSLTNVNNATRRQNANPEAKVPALTDVKAQFTEANGQAIDRKRAAPTTPRGTSHFQRTVCQAPNGLLPNKLWTTDPAVDTRLDR